MSTKDPYDEIRILPAHNGHRGPPIGPTIWILEDCGTMWGPYATRHEAIGARARLANTNCYKEDWFNVVPIPAGAIRFDDIRRKV
jgi:hypothetical protein